MKAETTNEIGRCQSSCEWIGSPVVSIAKMKTGMQPSHATLEMPAPIHGRLMMRDAFVRADLAQLLAHGTSPWKTRRAEKMMRNQDAIASG